jgi:hypothetical protein
MHENPFRVVPSSRKRDEAYDRHVDYKEDLDGFEHRYLYDEAVSADVVTAEAYKLERRYPLENQDPAHFYIATAWHDAAIEEQNDFWSSMRSRSRRNQTDVLTLTPDDIFSYYVASPQRADQEAAENRAREAYRRAVQTSWKSRRADDVDARVLQIDLEDQIASFRLEAEDRERRRSALHDELGNVIDGLPSTGRQSELQCVYLLRAWMKEAGLDHLLAVRHGLPREDLSDQKADVVLSLAGTVVPVQLKTEATGDAYLREHYERVRTKAAERTRRVGTTLLVLDTPKLKEAYALFRKGATGTEKAKGTRLKREILETLAHVLPKEAAPFIGVLLPPPPKESKRAAPERIDEDFLARNSNIPSLVRLGLLVVGDVRPESVRHAKETLRAHAADMADIFPSRAAFLNPTADQLERAKQALRD